jgi:hypothetical protein
MSAQLGTYLSVIRAMRCGQNAMNARSKAQPIRGYWQALRQRRRVFLAATRGDGAIWAHFVVGHS